MFIKHLKTTPLAKVPIGVVDKKVKHLILLQ